MAVEKPARLARPKTVGTCTTPADGRQSSQRILCLAGTTPLSIEVCEGKVTLGKIVCAFQVQAPSATRRLRVGIGLRCMTAGLPPSMLMMNT